MWLVGREEKTKKSYEQRRKRTDNEEEKGEYIKKDNQESEMGRCVGDDRNVAIDCG